MLPGADAGDRQDAELQAEQIIRISGSQKLGTACPTIVNRVTLRSTQVFSRSAARMPSGIEMTNARLRPTRPSVTVIGSRFWIRFATLSLKK